MTARPQLSLVIPLFNEAESLPELAAWIQRVAQAEGLSYEIWFVDDGSQDGSWEVIEGLAAVNPQVKGIRFQRNYGKSAALNEGFRAAQGDVVITMDADLQDSPDEIPELYRMVAIEGYHVVSGWKQKRYDPLGKTLPSKFFNGLARWVTGIKLHDFNCGLKAYQRKVIKSINVYGDLHRYIPYLAKGAGFRRIGEKVVQHQARKYGHSKFGFWRLLGLLDLLTLAFVLKYGRRPMHFFGGLGLLSFLVGGFITVYIIAEKQLRIAMEMPFRDVTDQPTFYLSIALLIIGVQMFLAGYIGELIVRYSPDRDNYLVESRLNADA